MGCAQSKQAAQVSDGPPNHTHPRTNGKGHHNTASQYGPPNQNGVNNNGLANHGSSHDPNNLHPSGQNHSSAPKQASIPPNAPRHNRPKQSKTRQAPSAIPPSRGGTGTNTTAGDDNTGKKQAQQQQQQQRPHDESWLSLWKALSKCLLDPLDVPSVITDTMSQQINQLSPTQVTFLQRRVRTVVRALPKLNTNSTNKLMAMNRFIPQSNKNSHNNGESTEGRGLVEKYHQLDEATFKKVFFAGNSLFENGSGHYNPFSSLFVLGSHLSSEALLSRAQQIAIDAARRGDVVMDVNKSLDQKENSSPPSPVSLKDYLPSEPLDVMGIRFMVLAYLVSLALNGSRAQKLQLLFYLSIPAKNLAGILAQHPAGGLPTWLLECDGDTVFSLSSLAHYYYFGRTFGPRRLKPSLERKKKLTVKTKHVLDWTSAVLTKPVKSEREFEGDDSFLSNASSSSTLPQKIAARREANNEKMSRNQSLVLKAGLQLHNETPVMKYLSTAKSPPYPDMVEYRSATVGEETWTMDQFVTWAETALSDEALAVLFYRLLGAGILPTPQMEREMVQEAWREWQTSEIAWREQQSAEMGLADNLTGDPSRSFKNVLFSTGKENGQQQQQQQNQQQVQPWGGIGGFDGKGGLGYGVMYCIDLKWWEAWCEYVGWSWDGRLEQAPPPISASVRPLDLSTERLLDRQSDQAVAGTLGSVELMKIGVVKGVDYVLIPPGVWDVLYELYGGGPPLPRMVLPPPRMDLRQGRGRTMSGDSKQMEELDGVESVEVLDDRRLIKIPESFMVVTHPWIFACHLCDASQPYRRGDAGPMSIRIMATPDQPLWRLYAEVVARLQVFNSKAVGQDGRGRGRLWKRIEASKDQTSRYGPWALLCKGRHAIWPIMNQDTELEENYGRLKNDWMTYADNQTIEGCGLVNGDRLMIEYAVVGKTGNFEWPREAAAKAVRAKRMADEESKFRRVLRGIDENGELLKDSSKLVGMSVDASDSSGRWYQVKIIQVERVRGDDHQDDNNNNDEDDEATEPENTDVTKKASASTKHPVRRKKGEFKSVRVDFSSHGGHDEWIDVDSDKLAVAGRYTGKTEESNTQTNTRNIIAPKSSAANKKGGNDANDQSIGKLCTLPGYGACGLANLGNTCYANSAVQCISYMPMLRSYLLSSEYRASGDLNKDNPLGTEGKLLEEFADLLRVMWSGKYGEKSPNQFRKQLAKQDRQFAGADQQDAQELLNYLLDVLHEDSNRVKKKPYVEALEDGWVKQNTLPRVGEESWRRFLRRNRSVMADVAMGQVLNTVTCPVCHFSSRNFDPFNLLSIPFPTVADVVFQCTVVRRATALNCPKILNRPAKDSYKSKRFDVGASDDGQQPPSGHFVQEQYVIAMSRLADIGDLRLQLQNVCGVPANRLRLCKADNIVVNKELDDQSPLKRYTRVTLLPGKEGPCVQIAKTATGSDEVGSGTPAPTQIFAFENTLCIRPSSARNKAENEIEDESTETEDDYDDDDDDDDYSDRSQDKARALKELKLVKELLAVYGDKTECRIFDTDPLPISKAISRSLWPRAEAEVKLGLRVDAIDHRDHWYPGSVVEIIDGVANDGAEKPQDDEKQSEMKVRIHFDNYSSKWDETYTFRQFEEGQVRPLYSHATPRPKLAEFLVHHRYTDKETKAIGLFGQAFFLQCHNEWSTARAGAHILSQTARYLQRNGKGSVDGGNGQEVESKLMRLYDKAYGAISELIDLLLECDRVYVRAALGTDGRDNGSEEFSNPGFDATAMSSQLVKKVGGMLHRLPFELCVCTADALVGSKGAASAEEAPFPFSLIRTIGNFMNARHAVVLHWRDPPMEKKSSSRAGTVMYVQPDVAIHKASAALLEEEGSRKSKNSPGSGGLHLGVCLTEFCKVNQLNLDDNWRCPSCKDYREGKQNMNLWRLPDLLTFHIKRFNCSARWREKISTKVNFPLTGLDMSEWCHPDSPAIGLGEDSYVYDLIAVVNHYGGMTGGHYVATCKATSCGPTGSEEVSYNFNGTSTCGSAMDDDDSSTTSNTPVWKLGRKDKESINQHKLNAVLASRGVSESAEPLWLQFDDDMVEPIPPKNVVSEMAYVLFYRRRHLTSSNVARYSSLE